MAGLHQILPLYAAMNRGPSATVRKHFPNIIPVSLPVYTKMFTDLNPWWVTGYLTLCANFACGIATEYSPVKLDEDFNPNLNTGGVPYYAIWHTFGLSRMFSEEIIMLALKEFFEANLWLRSDKTRWDLSVGQVTLLDGVIAHFMQYPLQSSLQAEFNVWSDFVEKSLMRYEYGERHSMKPETSLVLEIPKFQALIDKLENLRGKRHVGDKDT